ncbi:MAG TPA: hypothetical protein VD913_06515, partial [bacterium]|nr:hypothetical protein [bacterium]
MTKFIRFAGFLTAIIYSATTVFAQPGSLATVSSSSHPEVRTSVEGLSIPATLGTVQAAFNAANVKPSVFLIQDAHAVRDAQLHIRQLIDHLQREFGVGLVLLEGGKGKIDPTLVRTFPDAFLKEKIMTDYQNRGELTGAEMAAVLNPREAKYYGIEDWNLYQQHYLAYLKAAEGKESVLKTLEKIRENLDREREKVYSVKFNEFHRQWEKFEKENAYLVELLTYLVQTQKPQTSILQKYPDLAKLYRAFEFEKDENQNKQPVDISIRRMAESLKVKALRKMNIKQEIAFHKNYQSFVTGQMEAGKFLKFLVELGEALGVKAKLTPVMLKLLGRDETLETIKGTHLYEELDQWVRETESFLIATPQERVIAENYRRLKLLEALARLELTRGEWGQIQAYRIGRGADSNLLNITRYPLEAKLFAPALEFYRLALERDEAFSRNIGKLLKDQRADAAIVVAGGFHTEGFEKNLKEAGYSYAVITPKIESLEGQETYASVMAGKRSYQNRPGSTFYDAFIRASSVELMDELNEQDFRQTLRLWRDELLRNLSSEGRIAEAGEYTPYMDALFKVYYEKFGEGKKTAATGEQILKAIEKELDRYKQETLSGLWARFEPQLKEFRIGLESLRERKELTAQNIALLLDHVGQVKPSTLGAPLALARKIGFDSPDLISWQNTGKLPAGLSNTVQTGARELSESIRSETRAEQPGIQAISFKYYQAMPEDLFPKQSSVSPVGWFE